MQVSRAILSPCKDCNSRCMGCHSTCGNYAAYKAKLEEIRKKQDCTNSEYEFRKRVKAKITKRANKK